jgi:hypothetical protein
MPARVHPLGYASAWQINHRSDQLTATATDVHTFLDDIAGAMPATHPIGDAIIRWWLQDAHVAATRGDMAEVARLARCITDKIAQEKKWAN